MLPLEGEVEGEIWTSAATDCSHAERSSSRPTISAAAMASASVHPLETVFSASALIRALTRLSSVVCLKVLLVSSRKPISASLSYR